MLQKESNQLSKQKQEVMFYNNQCLQEVHRVGTDNGKHLKENFNQMSQLKCSQILHTMTLFTDF